MTNSKSNIFCPNCGANNNIEQNFCRFCSLNLQETTTSLTAQLTLGTNAGQLKKLELIKKISDFSSIGLTVIIAAGILIYLYSILAGTSFNGWKLFFGIGLPFLFLEMATQYLRRKNTTGYWEELNKTNSLKQNGVHNRETAKLLEEKPFAPVGSMTEDSTRLLFVENKTKKFD